MRAVLEVLELGQLVGVQQVQRHRANRQSADGQASGDQDDVVGDGERARHAVERERSILKLQVHEQPESRHARPLNDLALDRLDVIVVVFWLESRGEDVDCHEGGQADETSEHHGILLVCTERCAEHQNRYRSDQVRQTVVLAAACEQTLKRSQPRGLLLFEHVVQEDQQQEDAAEHGDLAVRVMQLVSVRVDVGECQVDDFGEAKSGGQRHDQDWEDEPHANDGDEVADGDEHLLPERAHLGQYSGVDDRVVTRESDLQGGNESQREYSQEAILPADRDRDHEGKQHVVLVVLPKGASHRNCAPFGSLLQMESQRKICLVWKG